MRDTGIEHIQAKPGQLAYGMGLGVLLLDDVYPGFPGDVRNASAYPFPIQYEIVIGVDIKKLVVDEDKTPCLPPLIHAAQKLEQMGCRAIAAECGYFAYFQREISASVKVPVFMSSLLQVTMVVAIAAGMMANLTFNPTEPAATITAYIVQVSLGDLPHDSIGYQSIFAAGLVLMLMTLVLNVIGFFLTRRFREAY